MPDSHPDFETLELKGDGPILEIWLNRPDKANAMNAPMWPELQAAFEYADAAADVRVVILAGSGRHFCAGLDLGMFGSGLTGEKPEPARAAEQLRLNIRRMQDNLTALERCRKPVLAAIHGSCVGGGIDLVCCADMRYASEGAYFAVREVDIGLAADVGTLQRLPRLIPDGIARELCLTGRTFDAEEAKEFGFINRVYPDIDALMAAVREIAGQIALKSPLAVRSTKQVLLHARDHSVAEGLDYVATWNAGMMSFRDIEAGVTAHLEKRLPEFED